MSDMRLRSVASVAVLAGRAEALRRHPTFAETESWLELRTEVRSARWTEGRWSRPVSLEPCLNCVTSSYLFAHDSFVLSDQLRYPRYQVVVFGRVGGVELEYHEIHELQVAAELRARDHMCIDLCVLALVDELRQLLQGCRPDLLFSSRARQLVGQVLEEFA
jgi:hypothetical protein